MTKRYMILFSIGKDRPGIVEDVSGFLFERGANIEDSRMAAMGGRFSLMTLFSCNEAAAERIRDESHVLMEKGLESSFYDAEDPSSISKEPALPLRIEVRAMDHPGIVRKVVHVIRRHGANIVSLNTEVKRAPLSGMPLFDLDLEAEVPVETSIARLKQELTDLASEENLDLTFKR
ncbi:MAG: hypothetical protein JRJ29_05720 [Deltaproteobacteria bacterium]|nr:hypothetical protein [Deltaproteobacteria bacterium]